MCFRGRAVYVKAAHLLPQAMRRYLESQGHPQKAESDLVMGHKYPAYPVPGGAVPVQAAWTLPFQQPTISPYTHRQQVTSYLARIH
jgi:hypothetical protein